MSDNNIFEYIKNINKKSKEAFKVISRSSSKDRNLAILNTSIIIKQEQEEILKANKIDIENAKRKQLNNAFVDRLLLDDKRIDNIVWGLKQISEMSDPIGVELSKWTQPNGLNISRISVPLGIIGIIYESRPNVTIDAGSLCIKSGNTAILRGGSDSINSSKILAKCMQKGLESANLPSNTVQLVESTGREAVSVMLTSIGEIDIIIPAVKSLNKMGITVDGPVPADTAFIKKFVSKYDVIHTMYHDQGLPVIKYDNFSRTTNVTLGLPIIRVSVDHGTATELVGTGKVDISSFTQALKVARDISKSAI